MTNDELAVAVKKLSPKAGDVLLLTIDRGLEATRGLDRTREIVRDYVSPHLDGAFLIVQWAGQSLEQLDEAAMREAGWVRLDSLKLVEFPDPNLSDAEKSAIQRTMEQYMKDHAGEPCIMRHPTRPIAVPSGSLTLNFTDGEVPKPGQTIAYGKYKWTVTGIGVDCEKQEPEADSPVIREVGQ